LFHVSEKQTHTMSKRVCMIEKKKNSIKAISIYKQYKIINYTIELRNIHGFLHGLILQT
jgi:hypothetical protein